MATEIKRSSTTAGPIESELIKRTPRSQELFARAQKALPGGNTRQAAYWEPYPLCIDRAQGTHLIDVDGNEYLDLTYNFTAMVHGHAYPPIVEAVAIDNGTGWPANNVPMIELAEQLVDRVDSVEQVRFTNSGTEAGLLALLVARSITGRRNVLMSRRGYHGALDEFESGTFDRPGPATRLAEFNDLASFEAVLDAEGDQIAAVFLEPVMGAGGVVEATPEFVQGLAKAAHRAGALLVLDEVVTFRLGVGGRQAALGVEPDLTMFGKLIGGGFPVGALGGRRDLLDVFDPAAMRAFHSGTYNGNPITMAAGNVAVRDLTEARIDDMSRLAERLEAGFRDAAKKNGLPFSVRRVGSLLNLYFCEQSPSYNMDRDDLDLMQQFHWACLNRGLMITPRGMVVLCTVMDERVIDEAISRAADALRDVAAVN